MDRQRRELEADEREYEERLADARKKEAAMKKARARVTKKPVRIYSSHIYPRHPQGGFRNFNRNKNPTMTTHSSPRQELPLRRTTSLRQSAR